jgi:hypothetical protein
MNIYLLYTTDDMNNMKATDVRYVRNKLESSLNRIPAYDLAMIDGVLWRVAVVDSDKCEDTIKKVSERLAISPNSQGFRGTALDAKGNTISKEFIFSVTDDCHKK